MSLTKYSIDTLLDLVEIRLSSMQVCDREDARELATLERCRCELTSLKSPKRRSSLVAFPRDETKHRRARPYINALAAAGV